MWKYSKPSKRWSDVTTPRRRSAWKLDWERWIGNYMYNIHIYTLYIYIRTQYIQYIYHIISSYIPKWWNIPALGMIVIWPVQNGKCSIHGGKSEWWSYTVNLTTGTGTWIKKGGQSVDSNSLQAQLIEYPAPLIKRGFCTGSSHQVIDKIPAWRQEWH